MSEKKRPAPKCATCLLLATIMERETRPRLQVSEAGSDDNLEREILQLKQDLKLVVEQRDNLLEQRNTIGGNFAAAAEWKKRDERLAELEKDYKTIIQQRDELKFNRDARLAQLERDFDAELRKRQEAEAYVSKIRNTLGEAVSFGGDLPTAGELALKAVAQLGSVRRRAAELEAQLAKAPVDLKGVRIRGLEVELSEVKRDREELARRMGELERDRERIRDERNAFEEIVQREREVGVQGKRALVKVRRIQEIALDESVPPRMALSRITAICGNA